MKNSKCTQCGIRFGGVGEELCPACLLRLGLEADEQLPPTEGVDLPLGEISAMPGEIGGWRLVRQIGEGGMGVVYLAEEIGPLNRRAALKRIKHGLDSKRVLERFDQERRVLAKMDHAGIARVIEAGAADDGTPYFVMEYVDGQPITRYCDRHRLDIVERLKLFARLCDAVDHAHRRGILHRDLKPSNVLVVESQAGPIPKVIDFGVARATAKSRMEWSVFTEFGRLVGTPEYMSPEQADLANDDLDTRTDVYALGVLLYELLIGHTPHDPKSLRAMGLEGMLRTIRESSFPAPSTRLSSLGNEVGEVAKSRNTDADHLKSGVIGELDWIVTRATERDRERRYGSPREFGQDVRRFLASEPVTAGPPGLPYRAKKFARRHRVGVAVGAAALLALLIGIAGLAVGLNRALKAESRALRAEAISREDALRSETISDFLIEMFRSVEPDDAPIDELTAIEALDRGVQRIERRFEDDPLVRATILDELGRSLERLGRFQRALPLIEESLELREKHLSLTDPELANTFAMMGVVYSGLSRYEEAVPFYEKAIDLFDASDEARPDLVGSPLRSLGAAYSALGRLEDAERAQLRAVRISREDREAEPVIYGLALDNLASTYIRQNRLEDAERTYQEALSVQREVGPNSVHTAQTLSNLSSVLTSLRRPGDAEKAARESLKIHKTVYGDEHSVTASSHYALGDMLKKSGRLDEAIEQFEQALRVFQQSSGPSHRSTAETARQLASAYAAADRNEEAIATLSSSIASLDEQSQPISLGVSYQELGIVQCNMNRLSDALRSFSASRRAFEVQYGNDGAAIAGSLAREGWCFRDLDRFDEAYARFSKGMKIVDDHPDDSVYVYSRYLNLEGIAKTLANLDRHAEAVVRFRELLAMMEGIAGEDDSELWGILLPMAQSLRAVGEIEEADRAESRGEALRGASS